MSLLSRGVQSCEVEAPSQLLAAENEYPPSSPSPSPWLPLSKIPYLTYPALRTQLMSSLIVKILLNLSSTSCTFSQVTSTRYVLQKGAIRFQSPR